MALQWLKSLKSAFSGSADPVVSDKWEEARQTFFKAIKKENTSTIEAVLKKYPEAFEWQSEPGTSLFIALHGGKMSSFRQLVDLGADIEGKSEYNQTPLEIASNRGKKDFVEFLIERGAKVQPGFVSRATNNDHHEVADLLKRAGKIRAAWLEKNPQPAPAAPPPAAEPDIATDEKITVLNPLQYKQPANTAAP